MKLNTPNIEVKVLLWSALVSLCVLLKHIMIIEKLIREFLGDYPEKFFLIIFQVT